VVHHGGISTVAKALAAGTPQLILPFAFDQMDNALRVKRLGAGDWLRSTNRSAAAMATALRRLAKPPTVSQAQAMAGYFRDRSGLHRGADWIEEFISRAT
jgi:UDP:flavonoid glycosyltransferase YjiC (YdhE family)